MNRFTSSPETQTEISILAACLRDLDDNDVLTNAAATKAIGRSVQNGARPSLAAARKKVESQDGIRFATVRGIGVKRLPIDEVPSIGTDARKKIRRAGKRAFVRLDNLSADNMTDQTRKAINTERVALGAVLHFTADKSAKKIGEEIARVGNEIPIGKTLALFTK